MIVIIDNLSGKSSNTIKPIANKVITFLIKYKIQTFLNKNFKIIRHTPITPLIHLLAIDAYSSIISAKQKRPAPIANVRETD